MKPASLPALTPLPTVFAPIPSEEATKAIDKVKKQAPAVAAPYGGAFAITPRSDEHPKRPIGEKLTLGS